MTLKISYYCTYVQAGSPASVWRAVMDVVSECLCYGTTLGLQSVPPEEPCQLAHTIIRWACRGGLWVEVSLSWDTTTAWSGWLMHVCAGLGICVSTWGGAYWWVFRRLEWTNVPRGMLPGSRTLCIFFFVCVFFFRSKNRMRNRLLLGVLGPDPLTIVYWFGSGLYGVTKLIIRNLTNGYFFFLSPV